MCVCVYVCVHVRVRVCVHLCVYLCVYVCVHVICTCLHNNTRLHTTKHFETVCEQQISVRRGMKASKQGQELSQWQGWQIKPLSLNARVQRKAANGRTQQDSMWACTARQQMGGANGWSKWGGANGRAQKGSKWACTEGQQMCVRSKIANGKWTYTAGQQMGVCSRAAKGCALVRAAIMGAPNSYKLIRIQWILFTVNVKTYRRDTVGHI